MSYVWWTIYCMVTGIIMIPIMWYLAVVMASIKPDTTRQWLTNLWKNVLITIYLIKTNFR